MVFFCSVSELKLLYSPSKRLFAEGLLVFDDYIALLLLNPSV